MVLRKEVIEKLSKKLLLPYTGIEQDWEHELADGNKIADFLYFYKHNKLSVEEKVTLMALILSTYDNYLEKNLADKNWGKIEKILSTEYIYYDLINYWRLDNNESDDVFNLTHLMRKLSVPH